MSARAAEWMGLEPLSQHLIGIQTTFDNDDKRSITLSLSSIFNDHFGLDLVHSKESLEKNTNTFNSRLSFIQLNWFSSDHTELRLAQQFEGEKNELEMTQKQLQIIYKPYPLTLSLSIGQGDVSIYTRTTPLITRSFPQRVSSDFSRLETFFSWWFEDFSIALKHANYTYEKDVSALSNRPVLQLILKPNVFLHSALLLSQEQSISFDIPLEQRSFTLTYQYLSSAIDQTTAQLIHISWHESLFSATQLSTQLSQIIHPDKAWALTLGLEWTF